MGGVARLGELLGRARGVRCDYRGQAQLPDDHPTLGEPLRMAGHRLQSFERRALAVEKERAIQENELKNQIELARREEELIRQRGENERTRVTDEAEAKAIETEAKARRSNLLAAAEAERINLTEGARTSAEAERMGIYRDYPTEVLVALSLEKLAGNLPAIEHLNLTPDFVGDYLNRLVTGGADKAA